MTVDNRIAAEGQTDATVPGVYRIPYEGRLGNNSTFSHFKITGTFWCVIPIGRSFAG